MKRVFKTKTFDRWARKVVSDALLCQAARVSDKEVDAAKIIASGLQTAEAHKLDELLADEILKEICNVKQKAN